MQPFVPNVKKIEAMVAYASNNKQECITLIGFNDVPP